MINHRTLTLNADFTPMSVISCKRALILAFKHEIEPSCGAEIVDFYKNDWILDSKDRKHPIPAVVRSIEYIKPNKNGPTFSKKNVFLRDNLTCQYCGVKDHPTKLTLDHVIPRAKWNNAKLGTPTRWENIVTCCKDCNTRKADKTLKESKFKLLREPKKPGRNIFILGLSPWSNIPEEWSVYLPQYYLEIINEFKQTE